MSLCFQIEKVLGAKMLMIGVDECLQEKVHCESSCSNTLSKSDVPYSVFTNTTSFVGVRAVVEAQCVCKVPEVLCLNGGTQLSDRSVWRKLLHNWQLCGVRKTIDPPLSCV